MAQDGVCIHPHQQLQRDTAVLQQNAVVAFNSLGKDNHQDGYLKL